MKISGDITKVDFSHTAKAGINQFTIVDAVEEQVSPDQQRLKICLNVTKDGHSATVEDTIESNDVYKLHCFAKSIGLDDFFNNGEIVAKNCVGRQGKIRLYLKKGSDSNYVATVNGYMNMAVMPVKYTKPNKALLSLQESITQAIHQYYFEVSSSEVSANINLHKQIDMISLRAAHQMSKGKKAALASILGISENDVDEKLKEYVAALGMECQPISLPDVPNYVM